jgi:serine/threonine protein kinase
MVFGSYPFTGMSDEEMVHNIRTKPLNLNKHNVVISVLAKDLLTKMLEPDPKKRIKWSDIYKH